MQECYGGASVPPSDRSRIQAAVRWHAAKALRERLSPEALADLGLAGESPEVRARKARARRSDAISALRGTDPEGFVGSDVTRALLAAHTLLTRIRPEAVGSLPADDLGAALRSLRASRRHAGRLVRAGEAAEEARE